MKADFSYRVQLITEIATHYGWQSLPYQENIGMASYVKDKMRVNVYVSKMTVATCMDHHKHGKTQLFRKNVTPQEIEDIFANPRVHTGKGYFQK